MMNTNKTEQNLKNYWKKDFIEKFSWFFATKPKIKNIKINWHNEAKTAFDTITATAEENFKLAGKQYNCIYDVIFDGRGTDIKAKGFKK